MKPTKKIVWFGIAVSLYAFAKGAWNTRELAHEPGIVANPWFWVLAATLSGIAAVPGTIAYWATKHPTAQRVRISIWISGLFVLDFIQDLVPVDRWDISGRFLIMAITGSIGIFVIYSISRNIQNEK